MVTENCKKIEPVVVKLGSKTNIPLFSEPGVHLHYELLYKFICQTMTTRVSK